SKLSRLFQFRQDLHQHIAVIVVTAGVQLLAVLLVDLRNRQPPFIFGALFIHNFLAVNGLNETRFPFACKRSFA
ncbi:MAG: hypothetical protein ACREHG_04805, partial [Candidatus Saccharimonadales bacterium]